MIWTILMIGGLDSTDLLSEVEYLHMTPEGITIQSAPSLPCKMAYASITADVDGGNVYVIGGEAKWPNGSETNDQVFRFDVEHEVCTELPKLLNGRSRASAFTLGSNLYVVGGKNVSGRFSSMECLDLKDLLSGWRGCGPRLEPGRYGHASCVLGSWVYVSGGVPTYQSLLRWHPGGKHWEEMEGMRYQYKYPGMACVTSKKSLVYVTGGFDIFTEVYDPSKNIWTQLAPLPDSRRLIGFLYIHPLGQIVVPGGKQNKDPTDTIYIYNVKANNWTLSDTRLPKAKYAASVVAIPKPHP